MVPTALGETVNLWNADTSQQGTEDLYRWGQVQEQWCDPYWCAPPTYANGYAGQVHWQWMIQRISSTNPQYDFYAIYLLYSLSPSYARGNPDPNNIQYAHYYNIDASVMMDLFSSQMVGAYKPDTSGGTESASVGIQASVSPTGPNAGFSAVRSYSKPDVTVSAVTDWTWAGYQRWDIGFGGWGQGASNYKQFTFEFSLLVVTLEGADLEMDLALAWHLGLSEWVPYTSATDDFTWTKTLRVYYPKDVVLTSAFTGGCQEVDLAWSQYQGKYFSTYDVYYKPSSGSTWTYYNSHWPAADTTAIAILGASTSYDFQLGWTVTLGYGRFSNILTAVSGPACGGGGGGGSVAAGTLIMLADGSEVPVQNLEVGTELMAYDMAAHRDTTATITRFVSVEVDNLLIIKTATGKPLIVDQNPAQMLYVKLPDDRVVLMSVTELKVGFRLFLVPSETWIPITSLHYEQGGIHVMYDIYTTAPYNYVANGYLDPPKQ